MGMFAELGAKIQKGFAVATDWLLIVMGVLLVLIALWRIDVSAAKYVVISGGAILACMGGWYRWRRLRREKR
jgi:hypothetical protein